MFKYVFNLFDLNTNVTTAASAPNDLSPEMKTFYDKVLIRAAEPELVHDQFGQKRPIPGGNGKKIEFRKFSSLPKMDKKPLTEGVTPDGQSLNVTKLEAEIKQYGGYVTTSDMLNLTAFDQVTAETLKLLGSQAGRTSDTVTRDVLCAGTWTIWKDSKGHKYVRLVSVPKSTKAKKLLKELKIVAQKLIKAGVKYNANNPCTSLSSALKHKRTNCATFISFGLQEIGILPKGKYIWLDKKIHGTGRNIIKKKAKIAYPRKKWKQAKLKPGDICGFANKPHTMVYVGKDKNGHALWYSAGGSDVKPKNLGPKRKHKYENRTVYVRIRLK